MLDNSLRKLETSAALTSSCNMMQKFNRKIKNAHVNNFYRRGLLFRISCPHCGTSCVAFSMDDFTACPYCRRIFSGVHGASRRADSRRPVEQTGEVLCNWNGETCKAYCTDRSDAGWGILIQGECGCKAGDAISLHSENECFMARVEWLKKEGGGIRAGLRKLAS